MSQSFIIYALPRSRTAWLSQFLSYRDWICYHEQAIHMRGIEDVKSFFSFDKVGTAETAAVQGRYLIRSLVPGIKEVVILRPVEEVIKAVMAMDVSSTAKYNVDVLRRNMEYGNRELIKASKEPGVLTVNFSDLDKPEICASIFEHCLPYKFDKSWWESLKDKNIQVNAKTILRYYQKHRLAIENFKKICKKELIKMCRNRKIVGTYA